MRVQPEALKEECLSFLRLKLWQRQYKGRMVPAEKEMTILKRLNEMHVTQSKTKKKVVIWREEVGGVT